MNKAKIAATTRTRKAAQRRRNGSNGAVLNGNGAHGNHAFRATQAQLEQVITEAPAMLTRCTRALRYRYVSRAYAKMLGRAAKEIAGKPIVEIIGKKALKVINPYIQKVLKGHQTEYEQIVPFAGIGNRCLQTIYVPDRDEAGNVIGWIASIVDITERNGSRKLYARTSGGSAK